MTQVKSSLLQLEILSDKKKRHYNEHDWQEHYHEMTRSEGFKV